MAAQQVHCALKVGTNHGSFQSPLAGYLPIESREAKFELCLPEAPRAVVLLFSGIGDQSRMFRRIMLARSLLQKRIGVLLITPPCYGERKPKDQWLHFLSSVESLLMQSMALNAETLVLLEWLRLFLPTTVLLGVCGLSWGGTMAACAGALWDGPIAITSE